MDAMSEDAVEKGAVLVVEDDAGTAEQVRETLEQGGWQVIHVDNVDAALEELTTGEYSVVLLDRMLGAEDGLNVVKTAREQGYNTQVIVLSALAEIDHRVEGLDAGADDYLTKPFSRAELLARVQARARAVVPDFPVVKIADLEVWLKARTAYRNGELLKLTPKEFDLLAYFADNRGTLVTRKMLLEDVFRLRIDPGTNVVDVHVHRLRDKLDKGFEPQLLQTIRGKGYVLNEPETA
ncbi:MAG: response regulator transcription factor [Hyphomicrobiaceae bacterium]|nr:response regulator transcription factor [Hyphomicrobiaceae bacterium]